jgi:hypothetical protein
MSHREQPIGSMRLIIPLLAIAGLCALFLVTCGDGPGGADQPAAPVAPGTAEPAPNVRPTTPADVTNVAPLAAAAPPVPRY